MTRMAHTQTPPRSLPFTTCQPQRLPLHCRSSLTWSHVWPAEEGHWVHLEWNIPRHLWLCQESSMFQHHLALLQCSQASHHPSWCLQEGPWSCPPPRQIPCSFASKVLTPTKQCYANIECELLACIFGAEWFCTYIFGHKFTIERWPQTPWADYAQEPGRCTSLPPVNVVTPPGLWHSHQILTQ